MLKELNLASIDPEFLFTLYSAPTRYYHNLGHIRACLLELDEATVASESKLEIEAAIWFHDAIYDSTRRDNEELSADLAGTTFRRAVASESLLKAVRELIIATKHSAVPSADNCRLMVDIDLSILGKPAETFDRYESAIRLEYAHVPDESFRIGRSKVLQAFMARDQIFSTELFRIKYESAARENIRRSLARLLQAQEN